MRTSCHKPNRFLIPENITIKDILQICTLVLKRCGHGHDEHVYRTAIMQELSSRQHIYKYDCVCTITVAGISVSICRVDIVIHNFALYITAEPILPDRVTIPLCSYMNNTHKPMSDVTGIVINFNPNQSIDILIVNKVSQHVSIFFLTFTCFLQSHTMFST
jgi:GxxExxY protein